MKTSFWKLSFWYAWRRICRKPKRFLSLAAIVCAILTSLMLMLLYMEAEWRADVMPDHEENYHFYFYSLTPTEKERIAAKPYVQASYDVYLDVPEQMPDYYENEFRVRVTWDNVMNAGQIAREIMDDYDVFSRPPYESNYNYCRQIAYDKFTKYWYGAEEANGMTVDEFCTNQAQREVVEGQVIYSSFYNKTANTYIFQPQFLALILLFCVFLAAAFTIIRSEDYRRSLREYGCLRAQGFRISHIFIINISETLLVHIVALPLSFLLTTLVLKFYKAVTASAFAAAPGSVYFTVAESVPRVLILVISGIMMLAALVGTFFVCFLYRNTPILSYLREQGTFSVSFVSKTSDAFEQAENVDIYNRLYAARARKSLIWNTAVIALMMPLPFHMLNRLTPTFSDIGTPEGIVVFLYTLLETAAILITALCVTVIASRGAAATRSVELGIFRALGASRDCIRKVTYPLATVQAVIILVLSVTLVFGYDVISASVYEVGVKDPKPVLEMLSALFSKLFTVALFALPSAYGGLMLFLRGFFRRSVISSIREPE